LGRRLADNGKKVAAGTFKRATVWTPGSGDMKHSFAHASTVHAVDFAPGGKRLATVDSAKTISLWDATTGKKVWTISEGSSYDDLDFSPDGALLASCGWDGMVRLWNAADGKPVAAMEGHADRVVSVDFDQDGRRIASASLDKTLRIWDVAGQKDLLTIDHPDKVYAVSFSRDGAVVASGCEDGKVRLFNAASGKLLKELEDHTGPVRCVKFAPQGDLLASSGDDKTVHTWEVKIRVLPVTKITTVPPPAVAPFDAAAAKIHQQAWADYLGLPVERDIALPGGEKLTMVLIPPGEFLMGSSEEEKAHFLKEAKAENDRYTIDLLPQQGPQHRVRITKPFYLGKYEVTQSQWQAVVGDKPSQFKDNPTHPVEQVSWEDVQAFLSKVNAAGKTQRMKFILPTEAQWEYACRAGTTTFWLSGNREASLGEHAWFSENSEKKTHPVGQLRPNGFGLYDMHGNVWEWCADWHHGGYYANSPVDDPSGPPTGSHRVNRGGSWMNSSRSCRTAMRTDLSPGVRNHTVGFRLAAEIPLSPQQAAVTPDGSGPTAAAQPRARLTGHKNTVLSVAFSPDGKTLASGSADQTIRLWNFATGEHLRTIDQPEESVEKVVFLPGCSSLVSTGRDGVIRIFHPKTSQQYKTLVGHSKNVRGLTVSQDGKTLASGGYDGTVRLWDLATGKERLILKGHKGDVHCAVISPDGSTVASGGAHKTIILWDAKTGDTLHTLTKHEGGISSIAIYPNGKVIASSDDDGAVRLWNVTTGKEIRTLVQGPKGVGTRAIASKSGIMIRC